ncbi:hypothetical protein JOD45_000159 [Scopulibacillus daqui]|uniref:Uncharacterized protein n=1 Tax=Scopulibacillus daqui TaxID=1469162 RepID=A0ABS2PV87_9BACL|nr:hypothetical protein [Scopulibacillus daqui]MBM7643968.1 hypothetical protein [Scopulibacillus daqui]
MKKMITKVFGKPHESKAFRFYYWFAVTVYFLAIFIFLLQFLILAFIDLSQAYKPLLSAVFGGIVFPFLFRVVYATNTAIYDKSKGSKGK